MINPIQKGYAPARELELYYEVYGDGAPLVLIHGGGSTIQTTFGNILPLLAQHFRVIAVELQAHGHTADRDKEISFEQDADDVAAVMRHLHINNAHLFGFSNGGQTLIAFAIRHRHLIKSLVITSAPYQRDGFIAGFFEGMKHASLDNMPGPLKQFYFENFGEQALQTMFKRDKARMLSFQGWKDDDLRSISAPVLILAGSHDVITPEHAVKMAGLIPNAELLIVPGDHGSFIGEICTPATDSRMPELVTGMVMEFLKRQ